MGAELRRLRGSRTLAEVANDLVWSESKISRIENGRLGIDEGDLERLLGLYGVPDAERARLTALTTQSRRQSWWEPYTDALTAPYEAYIAAEGRARAISTYEAQIVPGLLQTVEYAYAVIEADSTLRDPEAITQRVQVRMAREAVLIRQPHPVLTAVIDEAVLMRPIGGADVFRRQLLSLVEASERPNVTLQILSFSIGAHRALAGSFTLLEFGSESEPPIVYSEGLTGSVVRADSTAVRSYRESFEAICAVALSPEDTRSMLKAAADSAI